MPTYPQEGEKRMPVGNGLEGRPIIPPTSGGKTHVHRTCTHLQHASKDTVREQHV